MDSQVLGADCIRKTSCVPCPVNDDSCLARSGPIRVVARVVLGRASVNGPGEAAHLGDQLGVGQADPQPTEPITSFSESIWFSFYACHMLAVPVSVYSGGASPRICAMATVIELYAWLSAAAGLAPSSKTDFRAVSIGPQ